MHIFYIGLLLFMTYPKAMHDTVAAGLLELWVIASRREDKSFLYDLF